MDFAFRAARKPRSKMDFAFRAVRRPRFRRSFAFRAARRPALLLHLGRQPIPGEELARGLERPVARALQQGGDRIVGTGHWAHSFAWSGPGEVLARPGRLWVGAGGVVGSGSPCYRLSLPGLGGESQGTFLRSHRQSRGRFSVYTGVEIVLRAMVARGRRRASRPPGNRTAPEAERATMAKHRSPLVETARTRLHLKPGQRGTKKLAKEYGDRLLCVLYRYDEERSRRLKTVELVVEETPWRPEGRRAVRKEDIVSLRVEWQESTLRAALKGAGGKWNPRTRLWELRYDRVVDISMEDRIV